MRGYELSNTPFCLTKASNNAERIGRRGGLRSGRNRRLRKAGQVPAVREVNPLHEETMDEARERIDKLCPWLIGVESRSRKRRSA